MSQWTTLKERTAGRWQLPLLAVSLIMLIGSLLRLRPAPTERPFDEAIAYVDRLIAADFHREALRINDVLLAREGYTHRQRAEVHLRSARARFGYAESRWGPGRDAGREIVRHYEAARSHALPLTADDYFRLGRAFEWQEHYAKALAPYERAIELGVSHPLRLRRHMLMLMIDHVDTPPRTLVAKLERFTSDAKATRPGFALWSLEQTVALHDALGTLEEAGAQLAAHRAFFDGTDLQNPFAFLESWLLYRTGRFDEAERSLRTIRNRVDSTDPIFAKTGWLLGRVVMADDGPKRPQEALAFYSSVLRHYAGTPFGVASRVGSAEALVMLQRDERALEAYRAAIDELQLLGELRKSEMLPGLVSREVLRTSLGVTSDLLRRGGRFAQAVEYAGLAVSLTDPSNLEQSTMFLEQLGQLQVLLATELEGEGRDRQALSGYVQEADDDAARRWFAEAAATYLRMAQMNALNERLSASANWDAAALFARAGQREQAARLFGAFAAERPLHPLTPRALLRVGQLRQALGQLSAAVDAYQACFRRNPRSLDGARALVPLARCYLAMGPEFEELAEKTLHIVLDESEVFTPHAPEFAEALFLLGDALNRRGDYERAIATLEEALARYSNDPRVPRARFLLADSLLKSGLALKAELATAKYEGQIEQIRADAMARFAAAQAGFRQLIREYEARDPGSLSALERVYRRHAYLYEADCHFERRQYQEALKRYEEAVGMYRDTPSALAAYVQIINSHVFLDQPDEARAALARAFVLVDAIPESAFEQSPSPERREDWRRYFQWLERSGLF